MNACKYEPSDGIVATNPLERCRRVVSSDSESLLNMKKKVALRH